MNRLGRFDESLEILGCVSHDVQHSVAGEFAVIRAAAYIARGNQSEAISALVEARGRVFPSGNRALEAEVEYVSALACWSVGQMPEAAERIENTLAIDERATGFPAAVETSYPFSLPYWRVRAYELRSMISVEGERARDQAAWLLKAIEEFAYVANRDAMLEAALIYNAAVMARNLELPELGRYVSDVAEKFNWPSILSDYEFFVFRALGTRRSISGDHLSALRFYRRSADCTTSRPLRLLAILDRCRLMRELGETTTATEELDYALNLASQVDWEKTNGREREALSTLARMLASTDPVKARASYDRYLAIRSAVSPLERANYDRRQFADDCLNEAHILRAEGQDKRAVLLLLDAFAIWTKLEYEWLRAQAACDLAELTGEARFIDVARCEAIRNPNSSLARRVRRLFPAGESVAVAH